jgi:hypothetical protein
LVVVDGQLFGAGVDVGAVPCSGDRDVGPFPGGVVAGDQVGRVGGLALGGEGVLDVGEAEVGLVERVRVERGLALVGEAQGEKFAIGVDVEDVAGGAVADLSGLGVLDGVADLHVVVLVELVGAPGDGESVGAELVVLVADRLGAGVELAEVLV